MPTARRRTLVETVALGTDEVDVSVATHTTVVMMTPSGTLFQKRWAGLASRVQLAATATRPARIAKSLSQQQVDAILIASPTGARSDVAPTKPNVTRDLLPGGESSMPITRDDCSQLTAAALREYHDAGYWGEATFGELLDSTAHRHATSGVIDREGFHSWPDLAQRSDSLAQYFLDLGIDHGDVIAVQLPNWWEFVAAYAATAKIGAVMCQFPPTYSAHEVEFILGHSGARALVVPSRFKQHDHVADAVALCDRVDTLEHVLVASETTHARAVPLSRAWDTPALSAHDKTARGVSADDVLRIAFTSGTTGDPKAVLHTHNTTIFTNDKLNGHWRQTADSRILTFLPVGLNWGLFNTTEAVICGATLVFVEDYSPAHVFAAIEEHRCTHFGTSPSGLVGMTGSDEAANHELDSMELVVTGGAPTPLELFSRTRELFGCSIVELYGMLETGFHSCTRWEDDPKDIVGTVGVPVPWMDTTFLLENDIEARPYEEGEVIVRGPSVTVGYYRNPLANAAAFLPTGHFRTGDLGYLTESGQMRISGRKKDMIIHGGANVWAREVEDVIYQHPAVSEVAVIGIPDEYFGENICACIIPKDTTVQPLLAELLEFMDDKVAKYKLPQRVVYVTEFPMTPTGKIRKVALVDLVTGDQGL